MINKNKDFLDSEGVFKEDELEFGNFDEEEVSDSNLLDEENNDEKIENPKDYWNEVTEKAVIDFLYLNEFFYDSRVEEEEKDAAKEDRIVNKSYCAEMERRKQEVLKIKDREVKRNAIFNEHIKIPLEKLAENILFNYRLFVPGIDIKTQERDCYTFLYMKFTNYNPWKRTKSYSYYGTVAKHYYLGERKKHSKELNILSNYETNKEDVDSKFLDELELFQEKSPMIKLFECVVEAIESDLINDKLTKNDQKVADAIVSIFKNHEIIGIYNKNQVYQLIKNHTNLETKDITYSLHRFRTTYKLFRKSFNDFKEKNPDFTSDDFLNTTLDDENISFLSKNKKHLKLKKKNEK
jgi:hypothetical protein